MTSELDQQALTSVEPIFIKVFTGIGIIVVLYTFIRFFNLVQLYAKPCTLDEYKHESQPWALVTGSTDGIGFGFATELAESGWNVVLHGRNSSKLASRKAELEKKFSSKGVKFETLLLDASTATPTSFEKLQPLPRISILVNNVGGGGSGDRQALQFSHRTLKEVQEIVNTNAGFPTLLTRHMIPKLAQPAVIMNIGSVMDKWGLAYLEPYSGGKGFSRSFSDALRTELILEKQKIEVLHIRVLSAATPGSGATQSFMTVSPQKMARSALDRIGSGVPSTAACLRHEIMIWIAELFPGDMLSKNISGDIKKKIKKSV